MSITIYCHQLSFVMIKVRNKKKPNIESLFSQWLRAVNKKWNARLIENFPGMPQTPADQGLFKQWYDQLIISSIIISFTCCNVGRCTKLWTALLSNIRRKNHSISSDITHTRGEKNQEKLNASDHSCSSESWFSFFLCSLEFTFLWELRILDLMFR